MEKDNQQQYAQAAEQDDAAQWKDGYSQGFEAGKWAAQAQPVALTPMGDEGNEWYFDCDDHYIDVKRDENGKYSVLFRNRKDGSKVWHDQAKPVASKEMIVALSAYLVREMPAGTVIGDPVWWAERIAKVVSGTQPVADKKGDDGESKS